MTIKINEAACQALGAKLAVQFSSLQVVCKNLHHRVTQARENFTEVRCYNGGYIRPTPVAQGYYEIYAAAEGYEFTIRTEPLGTPLAVIEEVLTKEMLTSYLYEICARVVSHAASRYAKFVYKGRKDSDIKKGYDLLCQRDYAIVINGYHIAAPHKV